MSYLGSSLPQKTETVEIMATKKSGFSLIEILIVLGFISALVAFGATSISSYLKQLRLNQATTAFVGNLNSMGNDALRFSQRIDLNEGYLSSGIIAWSSTDGEFGRIELPHDAVISSVTKSIPMEDIWFSGRGLPFQQVSFMVSLNNSTRRVILLPTGIVVQQ